MEFLSDEINYYKTHPEELSQFIDYNFTEYYKDLDMPTLVIALKVATRSKGIDIQIEPNWDSIHSAVIALGYNLMPVAKAA